MPMKTNEEEALSTRSPLEEEKIDYGECRSPPQEEDFGCMLHAEGLKESIGSVPMKPKNHTTDE